MKQQLEDLRNRVREAFASVDSVSELESLRVRFLGKKGELTAVLKEMGKLSAEERPIMGSLANEIRAYIETQLEQSGARLSQQALSARLAAETIDVSLPGAPRRLGSAHPMSNILTEVEEIFLGMGFQIAEGPEVEHTYYCFDALNTGEDHPARDMQDTFYMDDKTILRTQTSSVQIRVMEKQSPPIRIISPGRVYRKDEVDATHSPMFHQIEGLVVDKGVTMGDLKGTLELLMRSIYGGKTKLRFRPHHFPYTEPSAEVDLECFACGGRGCSLCKGEGFIEMLGSGMVHPQVLRNCGIDPEIYSGFAFGIGLERLALMRYNITDMRLFFENDMRFLSQF